MMSTTALLAQQTLDTLQNTGLSKTLSGEFGENRSNGKVYIPANNDLEAIKCWLSRHPIESHTYRSYKREAERLLMWAIVEKQRPLSSLTMVDLAEYREFLKNPQPAERWISSDKHKKRLFAGPLSERSAKLSNTLIGGLFKFLVEQNYLEHNPHKGLPRLIDSHRGAIDINRSLTEKEWAFILHRLNKFDDPTKDHRAFCKQCRVRFIILFLYLTGLRIHELAQAKVGDIVKVERKTGRQIWLNVLGKGNKWREVPIAPSLMADLDELYVLITGRSCYADKNHPLIPPLNKRKSDAELTEAAIHKILKAFFNEVSDELMNTDHELANKLIFASAHWLRHTHGTHAVSQNIPLPILRDNMGHSNIAVTSQYIHSHKDERHDAFVGFLD